MLPYKIVFMTPAVFTSQSANIRVIISLMIVVENYYGGIIVERCCRSKHAHSCNLT